jgi:hypothetical protein
MGDPELDQQVSKFERRLNPRSRAEIERAIAAARETWAPRIDRYNYLLERRERADAELGLLRPHVEDFDALSHDLDWEYFRRLQLDGVLPSLPRVRSEANDHKNDGDDLAEEGENDHGGNECDFEVGSKG